MSDIKQGILNCITNEFQSVTQITSKSKYERRTVDNQCKILLKEKAIIKGTVKTKHKHGFNNVIKNITAYKLME